MLFTVPLTANCHAKRAVPVNVRGQRSFAEIFLASGLALFFERNHFGCVLVAAVAVKFHRHFLTLL